MLLICMEHRRVFERLALEVKTEPPAEDQQEIQIVGAKPVRCRVEDTECTVYLAITQDQRYAQVRSDVERPARWERGNAQIGCRGFNGERLDRARDILSEGVVDRKDRAGFDATATPIIIRDNGKLVSIEP